MRRIAIFLIVLFLATCLNSFAMTAREREKEKEEDSARLNALRIENLQEVTDKAESGDITSQLLLGDAYFFGNKNGFEKDQQKAFTWYLKAAQAGSTRAQFFLVSFYSEGIGGIEKDKATALFWLRKAAEQNFDMAQLALALEYSNGEVVAKDLVQAVFWAKKAAEQGYGEAQYCLGMMYRDGRGVKRDLKQAESWLTKAAEQNNVKAFAVLMNRDRWETLVSGQLLVMLQFDSSSAQLTEAARKMIDAKVQELIDKKDGVLVRGHTDLEEKAAVNKALDLKRAENVKDYLVRKGVSAELISVESAGTKEALVSSDGKAFSRLSRRVEVFSMAEEGSDILSPHEFAAKVKFLDDMVKYINAMKESEGSELLEIDDIFKASSFYRMETIDIDKYDKNFYRRVQLLNLLDVTIFLVRPKYLQKEISETEWGRSGCVNRWHLVRLRGGYYGLYYILDDKIVADRYKEIVSILKKGGFIAK